MEHLINDFEKAEYLQQTLINHCTNDGESNENEYKELRNYFLENHQTQGLLPDFVRTKRTLQEFWHFIKPKFASYAERRTFLWEQFSPLLNLLEKQKSPSEKLISTTLKQFSSDIIHKEWEKALKRLNDDPKGAITMASTLLESVYKHILDEHDIIYSDNIKTPNLYQKVSDELNLAPSQHQEQIFKQILGGCNSVILGIASLRNKISDAHGKGKKEIPPKKQHAELAVNLAGSMALFLISTHKEN